jgi:hypothetical protein
MATPGIPAEAITLNAYTNPEGNHHKYWTYLYRVINCRTMLPLPSDDTWHVAITTDTDTKLVLDAMMAGKQLVYGDEKLKRYYVEWVKES